MSAIQQHVTNKLHMEVLLEVLQLFTYKCKTETKTVKLPMYLI